MDYEQKYKEALEKVRGLLKDQEMALHAREKIANVFPELKKGDIRTELIEHIKANKEASYVLFKKFSPDDVIAWLEKQDNIDKASYEIAEKEKDDFVSGRLIDCIKSFNEFKEGNSYWFEYIGNDTYVGRSDDILNEKFHITPKQLYSSFTQQRPKENNAPIAYDKYVDECLNEASKHFFSDGEDKYSVADLFYAGINCVKSWFEKQGEKINPYSGTSFEYNGHTWGMCAKDSGVEIIFDGELKAFLSLEKSFIYPIYPKPDLIHKFEAIKENVGNNNNVEPKFRPGDWIIRSAEGFKHNTYLVKEIKDCYVCEDLKGRRGTFTFNDVHNNFKLWDISDAKDGDVLCYHWHPTAFFQIAIFKRVASKDELWGGTYRDHIQYGGYGSITNYTLQAALGNDELRHCGATACPATKEQRDLLFQKMKEAGYEWEAEKKEMRKVVNYECEDERIKLFIKGCVYASDITPEDREEIFAWLDRQSD